MELLYYRSLKKVRRSHTELAKNSTTFYFGLVNIKFQSKPCRKL